MNKTSLLILIFLLISNCSINKKKGFWVKETPDVEEIKNVKTILTKQIREEQEFNPTIKIKASNGKFNKNPNNNQNDIGETSYEGILEKIGKYKFSKFDDFEHTDVQPVFYNEHIIFHDNKGTIILYDQNQKKYGKKTFIVKVKRNLDQD